MQNKNIIDEMGILFEDFGVNPIMGRIFGILLSSEKARSLIEIAELLSLSKAAVSIQIRVLEKLGYCQKLPKTKNRQHFYILRDDYLEIVYRKRIEKEKSYLEIFEKLNNFQDESPGFINTRMSDFINFNNFMMNSQYNAILEWRKVQKNED